ncbi:transmembrane protein 164 isoform X2 [Megachile rotundata]|uniref:transmembrane protein 164 isoform X2 n=1 Tax=Megachile rotundata TaxID=143995 RepID=UPI000614B382|nr:PREDICTED: transmembrane protein 164 isoform X2 [Megachile rotundata]
MFEWAYDGVNASIPRNAGPECAYYISPKRRIVETVFISIVTIILLIWGYKRINLPTKISYANHDRVGKRILLMIMSLVLGIEIGFKFTSRTVVYILNPCHITTAAQIFADKAMYYIQHGLMVVIPYYLLRIGGVYNVEPLSDMSWTVFSYGLNLAYHFWVLQCIALPIQVNLSHILCAAILDPFGGKYYRVWTMVHQGILCPLLCKLFCYSSDYFLTKCPLTRVKPALECTLPEKKYKQEDNEKLQEETATSGNGHTRVN